MLSYDAVFKFNENHDPKTGRFTFSRQTRSAMQGLFSTISKPDGGFTYQPTTKDEPKEGFALSVYPERSFATSLDKFSFDSLATYVAKNRSILSRSDHYVGGWHDPESNQIFLDVSIVTKDRKKAESLAKRHDQIAYFDLGKGKSVTVNSKATSGGVAKGEFNGKEAETEIKLVKRETGIGAKFASFFVRKDDREKAYKGRVRKGKGYAGILAQVIKFNPYHDELGRFTTGGNATFISFRRGELASKLYRKYDSDTSEAKVLARLTPEIQAEMAKASADLLIRIRNKEHTKYVHARDQSKVEVNGFTAKGNRFNYTDERLALQDKLISSVLDGQKWDGSKFVEVPGFNAKPDKGQKPNVIFLGGRGGSGKSSFDIEESRKRGTDNGVYDPKRNLVLDADSFKAMLAFNDGHKSIGNKAALYHDESSDMFSRVVQAAKAKGLNTVLDFTLKSDKSPVLDSFKKKGYRSELHYLHFPREDASVSAIERFAAGGTYTGRWVPASVILSNTKNEQVFDSMKNKVDSWSLWSRAKGESKDGNPVKIANSKDRDVVRKSYRSFFLERVEKANPYHDKFGRFTTHAGSTFISLWGKQSAERAVAKFEQVKEAMKKDWKASQTLKGVEAFSAKWGQQINEIMTSPHLPGKKIPEIIDDWTAKLKQKNKDAYAKQKAKQQEKGAAEKAKQEAKQELAGLIATTKIESTYTGDDLGGRSYDTNSTGNSYDLAEIHNPFITSLPNKKKGHINDYLGTSGARSVNRVLNGLEPVWGFHKKERIDQVIKTLDGLMDKQIVGKDIFVHRNVAASNVLRSMGLPVPKSSPIYGISKDLVGKVYTEKGFSSTSVGYSGVTVGHTAAEGNNELRLRIKLPKEARGIYLGKSLNEAENELILARNTRFLITKVVGDQVDVQVLV